MKWGNLTHYQLDDCCLSTILLGPATYLLTHDFTVLNENLLQLLNTITKYF